MSEQLEEIPCPLCPRPTRSGRPLCNYHIQRVGQQVLDRYFAQARAVKMSPKSPEPARLLADTARVMIHNANQFDTLRAQGHRRPHWSPTAEQWVNPQHNAYQILRHHHYRHQFGLDNEADMAVLQRIAAELFPIEQR